MSLNDVTTVMWKEFKELLFQRGNMRGGWMGLLVFVAVFGVFLPLQSGPAWVESPIGLVMWAWVPFLLVSSVVTDSFAGERERHTLETLLASRLSDRSILFGKIAAAVAYGWGFALASVVVGLITVNVVHGQGRLLLYPPDIALGIVVLSLLVATLASGAGVLISLRAASVRQAQQTFSIVNLVIFIPIFLLPMLPDEWQVRITRFVTQANVTQIALVVIAILLIIDILLIAAAMRQFQRAKLILD
jgi:ABC-2 type transport system permease protein